MTNKKIRDFLKGIVSRFGYKLELKEPVQPLSNDPRELPYLNKLPYTVLHLPADLGVGLKFYSLSGKTFHPFVLALRQARNKPNQEQIIFRILRKYSDLVTNHSANDNFGFSGNVFPEKSHPYEITYPWSHFLPHQMKKLYTDIILEENKLHGINNLENLEGKKVSDKKVEMETLRLRDLLSSIQENGYKPQYHDALNCFVLQKEGAWKWFVESGQHRAPVLAVLGFEKIPVHVRQIIRREEVAIWPAVQAGIFTEQDALDLFDRMFFTEPPNVAQEWVKWVNEKGW